MTDEHNLKKLIEKEINSYGYWCWRVNSGSVRTGHGRIILAPRGTPDICVVFPTGWLEVKPPTGSHHNQATLEAQAKWRAKADLMGVRHAIVTSVREALDVVERWYKEDS